MFLHFKISELHRYCYKFIVQDHINNMIINESINGFIAIATCAYKFFPEWNVECIESKHTTSKIQLNLKKNYVDITVNEVCSIRVYV